MTAAGEAAVTGDGRRRGAILRLVTRPEAATGPEADDTRTVVLDTTATATGSATDAPRGIRDVAARVLGTHDLIAETSELLDDWVEAAGVVEALSVDGTSFWYYLRLREWLWLQERVLWIRILDALLEEERPGAIELGGDAEPAVRLAARLLAARDGIELLAEAPATTARPAAAEPLAPSPATRPAPGLAARAFGRLARAAGRSTVDPVAARRAAMEQRLADLGREPGRLLVLLEHARQRVETPDGPRLMNAYLGPVADRLRGTPLEPVFLDLRLEVAADEAWERLAAPDEARTLPVDIARRPVPGEDLQAFARLGATAGARIRDAAAPVAIAGVDLGPELTAEVAADVERDLPGRVRSVGRIRRVLRALRPAALLLADEYHRQDWLAAAALEEVPVAALQHGMIYRWHTGYVHRRRPPGLRLPQRTFVFGRWERDLLVGGSVYREDEVTVGGSPRLDLVAAPAEVDVSAVRSQVGVTAGERMVVVSGTWGPLQRRFHYPIVLGRLCDAPLPGVHLVVKLHPGERDDGPYRAVVEEAARAAGIEPPRLTIVRDVDLYQLLAAADAHLGVHSTVLTEAVVTGTRNAVGDGLAGADLLDYVAAGVATPVRSAADLLALLERDPDEAAPPAVRQAFLDRHFEPGSASARIADELLAWLAPAAVGR